MLTTTEWWEGDVRRKDSKNTVKTPGYFNRRMRGEVLPDNPYSHIGEWVGSDYFTLAKLYQRAAGGPWEYLSTITSRVEAPGIGITPFSWAEADIKFLSKVKHASVSVITMLAERKQTATLLEKFAGNTLYTLIHWRKPKKVLQRWLNADRQLRKWATRKLARRIYRCTTPAEAWLEYRFAVRPMMYDIRDALEAFEKGSKKQHATHISRKGHEFGTVRQKGLGPYGAMTGKMDVRHDWKIAGRFVVEDPSLAALGNLASVSASLWDLIPLSMVIDWAWDISTWLDLQNATLGLKFISGFKGLKSSYRRSYFGETVQSTRYRYVPVEEYGATWQSLYYRRTKMTSCPTPTIRRGTLGQIFGDGHIWDMLSIARQISLGKFKGTYYFNT